jgi:hypothetical protein
MTNAQAALIAAALSMTTMPADELTEKTVTRRGVLQPILKTRFQTFKKILDAQDQADRPKPDYTP